VRLGKEWGEEGGWAEMGGGGGGHPPIQGVMNGKCEEDISFGVWIVTRMLQMQICDTFQPLRDHHHGIKHCPT
jgi:hypothetical protein